METLIVLVNEIDKFISDHFDGDEKTGRWDDTERAAMRRVLFVWLYFWRTLGSMELSAAYRWFWETVGKVSD